MNAELYHQGLLPGNSQWPVTYISAIDGMRIDKEYTKDKLSKSMQWFGHPSVKGCALSHLSLWQKMVDESIPNAIIMEDDVQLVPKFCTKVKKVLSQLPPNTDILYIGALLASKSGSLPWYIKTARKLFKIGKPEEQTQLCDSKNCMFYTPQLAMGTHCYFLTLKGAQKLIDHLKGKLYYHVDYMMMTVPNLIFFVCDPVLATQKVNVCSSSIAQGSHFPFSINHILDQIPHFSGVSTGYLLTTPLFQVSGQVVNGWIVIFFCLAMIALICKARAQVVVCLFSAFILADIASCKILTRQNFGVDSFRSLLFAVIALAFPFALFSSPLPAAE